MPSYYVTYGGDRVTFQGVSGPVAWYHDPRPQTDQYVELWKNPGYTYVANMPLSQPISAFDELAISMCIHSSTNMESTQHVFYVPVTGLSSTGYCVIATPYSRRTATPLNMHRLTKFGSVSGTGLSALSGCSISFNPWYKSPNANTMISAVSGVKYAK